MFSRVSEIILEPLGSITTVNDLTVKVFYPNQDTQATLRDNDCHIITELDFNQSEALNLGNSATNYDGNLAFDIRVARHIGSASILSVLDHLRTTYLNFKHESPFIRFENPTLSSVPSNSAYIKTMQFPFFFVESNF